MPTPLSADRLAVLPRIRHGFFTRRGGVSQGIYASLNCGMGSRDDPAAVGENRARIARFLMAESLVTAHQVHGATAVVVETAWSLEAQPRADAIVTATRGLALGVLTADCVPVLFADAPAGVVGAAHAGWRGAFSGVLEATLAAMETLGADRGQIEAAVGPCITQSAYEVGFEFEQAFLAADAANAQFFARPDGDQRSRPHFDLPGYVLHRLARAGLSPGAHPPCTFAGEEDFFSYRRSQARNEADYGRQISAIVLT
jgi:purine-nucleoside/S-methyl-5'-thioadenosine phosphorylase / adenosine deaminase